jgi:hypothetical protein
VTRTLAGVLNSQLAGVNSEEARMRHFRTLSRQQQTEAIHRLAATGQSELTIARASGLAVEQGASEVVCPHCNTTFALREAPERKVPRTSAPQESA